MEALGVAANIIAVIDISLKVLQVCSQYAKEVKNATADIQELRDEVAILHSAATKVQELIQSPQGSKLKASLGFAQRAQDSLDVLSEVDWKLQPLSKKSFRQRLGFKSLKWPFESGEVHRTVGRIRRCSNSLSHVLQVDGISLLLESDTKLDNIGSQINKAHTKLDTTHSKLDETHPKLDAADSKLSDIAIKLDKVDNSLIMSSLPIVVGAAYNSYAEQDNSICLKNTRSELLQDIDDWLDNANAQTIFWLQGMAGTGKSTIARTVATAWDQRNCLGASFFFKRGGGDRGNLSCFYTTIASQLAARNPDLASSIKAAIDQDPFITSKMAEEQFEKLILQPISTLRLANRALVAIVIDALDESDGDESIKRLINIFTRAKLVSNVRMRVFITSRPELHVRLGFRAVAGSYQDFVLHEIPDDIIKRDIQIFFMANLKKIREEYNLSVEDNRKLADTWPGLEKTMALVDKAAPLFIFAATVCRFLSQRRSAHPDTQLQKVLAFETKSQESKLNATYLPPLEQQLEGLSLREQDQAIENFHQVVGTIILLEMPLTVSALANLVDVPVEAIYIRLDVLHSVLNYPKTSETPVRLLHLSFRDFLLDPEKKGTSRFWVDENKSHGNIAARCLRILNSLLKEDICNIMAPGTNRSVVPPGHISSCIPMELQYSCRYWAGHLQKAPRSAISSEEVLMFLESHLLHFLECLSLIGRLSELYDMIIGLQAIARENGCTKLYELLVDIYRFLQTNFIIIDQYPLQLYSSLRYTIPSTSLVHPIFANNKPDWLVKVPDSSSDWDQRQHVLEGHETEVAAISFSLDSTRMASLSEDGNLRVWRLDTGQCIREIWIREFTSDSSPNIAISTNPMWIVTKVGNQLCLWHGDTAEVVGVYGVSSTHVHEPQLSPCAQYCAFIDAFDRLVVLHLTSVDHQRLLYFEDSKIVCISSNVIPNFLAFSPDSRHIARTSDKGHIESLVWDITSGHCIKRYKNKAILELIPDVYYDWRRRLSVRLCVDGSIMLAFPNTESKKQIHIRSLQSGNLMQILIGHKGDIETTSFLKEGTILGSNCKEGEIRTWDIETGACLTLFLPFSASTDINISPNYQIACSFYRNKAISIIWNSLNRLSTNTRNGEDYIVRLVLSTDTTLAASFFASGMMKIWEVLTGNCIPYFDDDSYDWEEVGLPWLTPNFEYVLFSTGTGSTGAFIESRRVSVWGKKTGQLLGNFATTMGLRVMSDWQGFYSTIASGRDLAISPNSCLIALVHLDTLRITEVVTGITTHTIAASGQIQDIMFSPDSRLIFILSFESTDYQDHTSLLSRYDLEKSEMVGTTKSPRIVLRIVDIPQTSAVVVLHAISNDGYYREQVEIIDIRTEESIHELVLEQGASHVLLDRDFAMCAWRGRDDKWVISNIWSGQVIARLNLVYSPSRISFNTGSTLLSTSMGDIQLNKSKANLELMHGFSQYDRVGYGISDNLDWILWNSTKILWLPPALRPERRSFDSCVEISRSTVMIGTQSGRVLFFTFDIEDLMRSAPSFTL